MAQRKKPTASEIEHKKQIFRNIGQVDNIETDEFLKSNFLPYAWETVLDRALTDVSGLKPVQRRAIYTMYKAKLSPNATRTKVAKIAGAVMDYHPHGDASIAEALKKLAQEHSFRVPMVDGKGDFGTPENPKGAAPRYIEARLSKAAWLNVQEIAENAVQMVPTYDSASTEPMRLPTRWPIAVINGSSGIATGYASNIPSHNPSEIMKACKELLNRPNMTDASLLKIVKGPDFNMGGYITSYDGVEKYLTTGKGTFVVRGRHSVDKGARNRSEINFYEIPYGQSCEKIIGEINKAMSENGLFKDLETYKNLSGLENPTHLKIVTKPNANYYQTLADLFKYTSLEVNFPANLTIIIDDRPVLVPMRDVLLSFIEFRRECVTNKTRFQLDKLKERLHYLEGMTLVLLDIDKAIEIIRNSRDDKSANNKLQKEFKIDRVQADHVLAIQLRRLTKMDSLAIEKEHKESEKEVKRLTNVLGSEKEMNKLIAEEFDETAKIIGDERKTVISDMSEEEFEKHQEEVAEKVASSDDVVDTFITTLANGGFWRADKPYSYTASASKLAKTPVLDVLKTTTADKAVFVDSEGVGHRIPVSYITEKKTVKPKDLGFELPRSAELVGVGKDSEQGGLVVVTASGIVKVVRNDYPSNSNEFPVITLKGEDKVVSATFVDGSLDDYQCIAVASNGNVLRFDISPVNPTGHRAAGVVGMKFKDKATTIVSAYLAPSDAPCSVVTVSDNTIKVTDLTEVPTKGRAGMGVLLHTLRSGESLVKDAFVGPTASLVSCSKNSPYDVVTMPQPSKRAARGDEVESTDCYIGCRSLL